MVIGTGPKHISIQTKGILNLFVGDGVKPMMEKFKWLKDSHLIEHWPIEEMAKFEDKEPVVFKFEPVEMTFMNLDDEDYPQSKGKEYFQII